MLRASLAAQRLRICLPAEETQVQPLVPEEPHATWQQGTVPKLPGPMQPGAPALQ